MPPEYNYVPLINLEQKVNLEDGSSIKSPALFDLLESLCKEERHEILDVLPAGNEIINYFSNFYCKLYLPGCMQKLSEMTFLHYDSDEKLHHDFTEMFGLDKKNRANLNIIFLWDLPNYLDRKIMRRMVDFLSPYMNQNIKLHFYIHTKQQMPASFGRYTIQSDCNVKQVNESVNKVECPLYFKEALQKIFYPFKVKRSMLLATGLQEYVMELDN